MSVRPVLYQSHFVNCVATREFERGWVIRWYLRKEGEVAATVRYMDSMNMRSSVHSRESGSRESRSTLTKMFDQLGQYLRSSPPHSDSGGWNDHCPVAQQSIKATVINSSHPFILHMVIHACLTAYTPLCANQMPVLLFRCSIRCAI